MRVWLAIWVGSTRITREIAAWVLGGVVLRPICLAAAALFLKGWPGWDIVTPLCALAWLGGAIVLGLRAPNPLAHKPEQASAVDTDDQAPDDAEQAQGTEQPTPKMPDRNVPIDQVAGLLRHLHTGGSGVHLKDLAKALPGPPWATREARALLGRLDIRVRAGVRAPGVGPREGVHRDDFPPLPSPSPDTTPDGVIAAGQSNNNDNNNSPGGYPFTVTDDPDNPARANVHHHEKGTP